MRFILVFATVIAAVSTLSADTVRLEASRDATLIEDAAGAWANGSGPVLFAGRTNQPMNGRRRALVAFDVASSLPAHAIIEEVSLTLFMTTSHPEPRTLRLHRVLSDWGEGPSASSGGGGAPSQPGDATWMHTYWDSAYWHHAGGDLTGRASAEAVVEDSDFYTWTGGEQLLADVRLWAQAPGRNFGWILVGDELEPQSVKSFASREESDEALRPVLEITYRLAGEKP